VLSVQVLILSLGLTYLNNGEKYANLKTQCYYHLAQSVNLGEIYLTKPFSDISEKLIEELEQVKRDKIDADGKLYLMPKDKVKEILGRSPDYSDMLMMRKWFDIRPVYDLRF